MPALEVTIDEADRMQFDATEVRGKDPNFHYRWARCGINDEASTNITRHELHGYEIVKRSEERSILDARTRMKKAEDIDDTIRWGDMILMRIPKEEFERRNGLERARIVRATAGVAKAYKNAINRIANAEDNAFEEHKSNPNMRTVPDREDEPMSERQAELAMRVASGIEEDLKED